MLNMVSLLILSVPVGFLGSLTGLGGASILIPILVFLGIPVKEATACGMASIIATSSGSACSYVREKIAHIRVAMFLEMFITVGAIAGTMITTLISPVFLYFFFAAFLATSFLKRRERTSPSHASTEWHDRVSRWLNIQGSSYDEAYKGRIDYKVNHALLGGRDAPGGIGRRDAGHRGRGFQGDRAGEHFEIAPPRFPVPPGIL